LILNVCGPDVPPPGAGVTTAIEAFPTFARSLDGICALSEVAETKFVVNALPFHAICEEDRKFKPVTDNVNPAPPALAEVGESPVTLGEGLSTVKLSAVDVPPPGAGLSTVTLNEPAVFRSEAGGAACNSVPDTYVVFYAAPLHCTVEELIKPLPFTVSTTAAPPRIAD
jgi:hypothetical protein